MAKFSVFYMKPEFFRDGTMGVEWLQEKGMLPKANFLGDSHTFLKNVEYAGPATLDMIFYDMQGENWSPNGEARDLIQAKGLRHTSMSVGDVIVDENGNTYMVDRFGFRQLDAKEIAEGD